MMTMVMKYDVHSAQPLMELPEMFANNGTLAGAKGMFVRNCTEHSQAGGTHRLFSVFAGFAWMCQHREDSSTRRYSS